MDRGVNLQRGQALRKLVEACADGRLTPAELNWRAEVARRAVSYEELSGVMADLPGPGDGAVAGSRRGARRWLIGFLRICASSHFPALRPEGLAVAVLGEVAIDLARTPLTAFSTQIVAIAAAGGEVRIIVPPSVRVEVVRTRAVRAAADRSGKADPMVPVVRVTALSLLGSVRIQDSRQGGPARRA